MNKERKNDTVYLIRYLHKLISQDFDKRLSEYGLTCQQGRILFYIEKISKEKDVHQNDIENEFHLSKSTVSGLVKRMEKKGIIQIIKKPPYVNIIPTEEGSNIVSKMRKNKDIAIDELFKDVNKEDKDNVINTLNKMIENMEGGKEDA